jgi:hypothetical protein
MRVQDNAVTRSSNTGVTSTESGMLASSMYCQGPRRDAVRVRVISPRSKDVCNVCRSFVGTETSHKVIVGQSGVWNDWHRRPNELGRVFIGSEAADVWEYLRARLD